MQAAIAKFSENNEKYSHRILLMLTVVVLSANQIIAQTAKQFLDKASQRFEATDYYGAAEILKQGTELYTDNLEMRFMMAESYRKYNDYAQAAEAYKNIVTDDKSEQYPKAQFWYALMLKQMGKYNEAIKQLEKYKAANRSRTELSEEINRELESAKWSKENQNRIAPIKIVHLGENINSVHSDFNPFTTEANELIFTSLKKETKSNTESRSKLYAVENALNGFLEKINSSQNNKSVANGSFSADFSEFYFNICDNEAKKICQIYFMSYINEWSAPKKIEEVNTPQYTATQPFLAQEKDGSYLYFSSNRPGTMGGMDIWRSKRNESGKFSAPENFSVINTPKDEYSVFYDEDSSRLYFASDGWKGFGGLDIFYYDLTCKCAPKNLGLPINSPANDFGYTLSADRTKSYFASNRKGSLFIKAQTCCYDIWMYETGFEAKLKKDSIIVMVLDSAKSFSDTNETAIKNQVVASNIDSAIKKSEHNEKIVSENIQPSSTVKKEFDKEKVKKLIPVTLYFHNDEPDCCNLSDTTNLNYANTYEDYWKLLSQYKINFAKGLDEGKKTEAEDAIFYLFTNRVEKGYSDLVQLSTQVLEALEANQKVQITIQGYCSPLNYNLYNVKLGYRRVASLINYFYQYRNGTFQPYLKNKSLILKKQSFGEERAAKDVSDSREDTQNSIYNPKAAMERKVEIISVEIK